MEPNLNTPEAISQTFNYLVGTWQVEGVIVTTEIDALIGQLDLQEQQYNAMYTNCYWVLDPDKSASLTINDPYSGQQQTIISEFDCNSTQVALLINGTPTLYEVLFLEGQMVLINTAPTNTFYYVFIKRA